jgi:DNA repair photolyase
MEKKFTEELKSTKKNHQFADDSINFITGCGNDCTYCSIDSMMTFFHGRDPKNWKNEVIRQKDLDKKIKKYPKMVMFPSSHDIRPIHLKESIQMLEKILKAGNEVLVVTKPNLECITKICETFTDYKAKILFRFTIGSTDSNILKYWETNAPSFEERFECLKLAFNIGYQTSISAEPLMSPQVDELISKLSPFVTETIWIGPAQQLIKRLKSNGYKDEETLGLARKMIDWQFNPIFIRHLYDTYKDNPMIRWKYDYLTEMSKIELMES